MIYIIDNDEGYAVEHDLHFIETHEPREVVETVIEGVGGFDSCEPFILGTTAVILWTVEDPTMTLERYIQMKCCMGTQAEVDEAFPDDCRAKVLVERALVAVFKPGEGKS